VIEPRTGSPAGALMQKSMAVPLSGIFCGLPGALSFRLSVAVLAPPFAPQAGNCSGLNATWIVQVAPGAVFAPVHESADTAKSPGFDPVLVTDVIVSVPADAPELEFVTTMGWGVPPVPPASWLPKLTLVGTETPA
jgi:hypothetical protein